MYQFIDTHIAKFKIQHSISWTSHKQIGKQERKL
jgi:hypothetical protein